MMLPRSNNAASVQPMSAKEVQAVARGRYGKLDRMVKRLLKTIEVAQAQPGSRTVYQMNPIEVRWLEYPDLEPVRRTANDWLRTAVLAYGQYVVQQLEDELRRKGRWDLWEEPITAENVK